MQGLSRHCMYLEYFIAHALIFLSGELENELENEQRVRASTKNDQGNTRLLKP